MTDPSTLPTDPIAWLEFIKTAYASKTWTLVVAAVLMLIVRGAMAMKLTSRFPAEAAKWVAVVLAMIGALATNLIAGGGWLMAGVNGVTAGLMAIGAWETIGKNLPLSKKAAKSDDLPEPSVTPP